MVFGDQVPRQYRVVDPRTGEVLHQGVREDMWLAAAGDGHEIPGHAVMTMWHEPLRKRCAFVQDAKFPVELS